MTSIEPRGSSGTLGVSYDEDSDRIVLVAEELVAEGEDGDVARCAITRAQAAAFAIPRHRARRGRTTTMPDVRTTSRPSWTRVPKDKRPPAPDHLTLLDCGEVEILGRLPWSSNRTYLANCRVDGSELAAVYKPGRGERPLWDFGDNLWRREVAAYELSAFAGWNLVPETVARVDGPLGAGSMQRFVPSHFEQHYFTLLDDESDHDQLRSICAFDVVANNADRKSGHCLLGEDGRIWAIDNGLCFHREPKLRTVIWEFAGDELPEKQSRLREALDGLPERSSSLLEPDEIEAIRRRAARLLKKGTLPGTPSGGPRYPWPLV